MGLNPTGLEKYKYIHTRTYIYIYVYIQYYYKAPSKKRGPISRNLRDTLGAFLLGRRSQRQLAVGLLHRGGVRVGSQAQCLEIRHQGLLRGLGPVRGSQGLFSSWWRPLVDSKGKATKSQKATNLEQKPKRPQNLFWRTTFLRHPMAQTSQKWQGWPVRDNNRTLAFLGRLRRPIGKPARLRHYSA